MPVVLGLSQPCVPACASAFILTISLSVCVSVCVSVSLFTPHDDSSDYEKEQAEAIERAREREARGEIRQCNQGRWPFKMVDNDGEGNVKVRAELRLLRSVVGEGGILVVHCGTPALCF